LSPNFNVAGFQVDDYNALPVSVTYNFMNEPDKKKTMDIFPTGSNFPCTKTITFKNKLGGMNLLVHYKDGAALMPGLPH